MANIRITDLVTLTEPVSTDVLPIVDVSLDVTKKISIAEILRTASLGSQTDPGISFDGDTDTGVYSPGANQLAFTTNGSEALRITSDGNVGIGTTNPEAKLSIVGTNTNGGIKIVDSSTSTSSPGIEVIAKRSDANNSTTFSGKLLLARNRTDAAIAANNKLGSVSFGGNHTDGTEANILYSAALIGVADGAFNDASDMPTALAFYTGSIGWSPDTANANPGAERLRITSDGRVGIGTTAPATKLQLTSDPGPTLTLDTFGNTAGELIGAINFNNRTSAPSDEVLAYVKAELTSSRRKASLQLGTGSSGPATTKLYIDSEGKVGIGTTSPQAALDINAAASTSPFIASINSSEKARIDNNGRLLVGTSSSITTIIETGLQVQGTGADGFASIGRWSANAANPGLLFNKSRGASVGTRAIVENNDNLGGITFTGDDGSAFIAAARIQCQVDGTPAGPTPGPASMPGRLVFSTTASEATTPSPRMTIDSDGNVGIGTSSPGALLDVNGSLSKNSGSFKIDHPLPALTETHHLVHSFVEAPDASNLYAGMVQLSNGVAVVNIDIAHRMTEGTFEALNDPQSWSSSNESGYSPVKSSLSGNLLTIECQDQTSNDTVYYEVRGIRKDQHMIETEWTDESGRVITEPLKQVLADAGL